MTPVSQPRAAPALRLPLLAALACGLCACASGPPRGGPADPPPPPPRPSLFISPAGEPFRSPPGAPYPVAAWFAAADTDHDGRLTLAEFRADAERYARTLDKDGDGLIDGFELSDYEHSLPEMTPRVPGLRPGEGQAQLGTIGQGPPGGGRGRGRGGQSAGGGMGLRLAGGNGAAAYGLINDPQPVAAADRDLDGRVSMEEARWTAAHRFALLDKDGDGVLTLAELPRTPAQAGAERAAASREQRMTEADRPANPGRRRPGGSIPPGR